MGCIKGKRQRTKLGLMALEPRMMFDGAAVVDATHAHAAADASAKALIPNVPAPVQVQAANPTLDGGKTEVVFVDTSVAGYQAVEAAIKPGVEIEEIAGGQSGLAQIASWAESHSGYDSITVLAKGSEASLQIGTDTITDASLSTPVVQAELAEIGSALKSGGELLIEANGVGQGSDGQQLVNDLASATGATVGAFSDMTDATGADGNWTLDNSSGAVEVQAADPSLTGGKTEVVFIDTTVTDYRALEADIHPGIEIELIDGNASGLAQMAQWAASHTNYDSIQILSHGAVGMLQLGTDAITSTSLSDPVIQAEWAQIGGALKTGGEIELYGCDVASGSVGQSFVNELAVLTGASVAASTDVTGIDGNWTLEYAVGQTFDPDLWQGGVAPIYGYDLAMSQGYTSDGAGGGTLSFVYTGYIEKNGANTVELETSWFTIDTASAGYNITVTFTINWNPLSIISENANAISTSVTGGGSSYTVSATWNYTVAQIQAMYAPLQVDYNNGHFANAWYIEVFAPSTSMNLVSNGQLLYNGGQVWNTNGDAATYNWVVNTPPTFDSGTSQTLTLPVNSGAQNITSDLVVSDTDASQTETWTIASGPSNGTLTLGGGTSVTAASGSSTITPGGAIVYTPNAGYNGTDTFSVQVSDGQGGTVTKTFSVVVDNAPTVTAGGTTAFTQRTPTVAASDVAIGGAFADSDWVGGTLAVKISGNAEASDTLFLPTTEQQSGAGFWIDNSNVIHYWDGHSIFTATVGTANAQSVNGSTTWTIALSGAISNTLVQALAEAIQYNDTSYDPSTANRTVTFTATDKYGLSASATQTINVTAVNEPPSLANLANAVQDKQGTSGVLLDSSATISDANLDDLNNQLGDYSGASLTIVNQAGTSANDVISVATGANFTVSGSNLVSGGHVIGSFTDPNGSFTVTFADNGTPVTTALVNDVLQHINYSDSNFPTAAGVQTRTMNWTFSDGNTGAQGPGGALTSTGSTTVTLDRTPVLAVPETAQTVITGHALNYALPAGTFTDPDGTTLTYTATLVNAQGAQIGTGSLPTWLTYAAGSFTGTPAAGDAGTDYVKITATDANGLSVADTLQIAVVLPPAVTGARSVTVNDNTTATPLSSVTVTDGSNEGVTVTVGYDATLGAFSNASGWTAGGSGATSTLTKDFASATAATTAVDGLTYAPIAHLGNVGTASSASTMTVQIAGDTTGLTASDASAAAVTVDYVNTIPVVTVGGGTAPYAGRTAVTVDPGITVVDPDDQGNGNWNGGSLNVSLSINYDRTYDQFSIANSGGITLVGTAVKYDGTQIGTVSGENTDYLTVSLNGSATSTAVQALAEAIQFSCAGTSNSGDRTVVFRALDGAGAGSGAVSDIVHVATGPLIASDYASSATSYTLGTGAQVIDSGFTARTVDVWSSLSVSVSGHDDAGNDVLSVVGNANISVANGVVSYQGSQIGTIDSVNNGAPGKALTIALLGTDTNTQVQALCDAIGFTAPAGGSTAQRTVTFSLTDGIGTKTATDLITINNPTTADTAPVFGGTASTDSYTKLNTTPILLNSGLTVSDSELGGLDSGSGDYAGATLTVARQGGANSYDVFGTSSGVTLSGGNVSDGSTVVGTYSNSGGMLSISFNSAATGTAVNDVLQHLTFRNTNAIPGTSAVISVSLNDGNTGSQGTGLAKSATTTQSITIDDTDLPPAFANGGNTDSGYVKLQGSAITLDSALTVSDTELAQIGNYAGAVLTVSRDGGADAYDIFGTNGTVALSNGSVTVSGTTVGSYTNAGGTLTITFGGTVSDAQVNSVLQHVTYQDTDALAASSVQIDWTLNDGNTTGAQGSGGAHSGTTSTTIAINNTDQTPAFASGGNTDNFVKLSPTPITLNSGLTVSDPELAQIGNYAGAVLTVSRDGGANAYDVFGSTGPVVLANGTVTDNGAAVGTYTNAGGQLQVTFAGTVTDAQVNDVLQHVTYKDTDAFPNASVQIDWSLNDGNSGVQGPGGAKTGSTTTTITVDTTDYAPVFGGSAGTPTYVKLGSAVTLDGALTVSDPELSTLNGGLGNYNGVSLTIARTGGASSDDVFGMSSGVTLAGGVVTDGTTAVGTYSNGAGTLAITFNSAATTALVDDVLQHVTYRNSNAYPSTSVSVTVTVNDGTTINQGLSSGKSTSTTDTVTIDTTDLTPSFGVASNSNAYTENASAIVLNAAQTASDPELAALNSGNGNYAGAVLTVHRDGAANANDVFGENGAVALSGGNVTDNGTVIRSYTNSGGQLQVIFNSAATGARVNDVLQHLTYVDADLDPSHGTMNPVNVQIDWTLNDGNGANPNGAQGPGGSKSVGSFTTVTVTPVNAPPTLSVNTVNSSFTEGALNPTALFSGATINTVEYGQTIKTLTLTVSNVTDGAAETLTIDGTVVALTNGASATTATDGAHVGVTLSGTTATVTISSTSGLSVTQAQTLINGLAYGDSSVDPSYLAQRVVTLTSLQDSGGTANGGVDTGRPGLASDVTVISVNNAPTIAKAAGTDVASGQASLVLGLTMPLPGFSVADVDAAIPAGGTLTGTGIEQVTVSADAGMLTVGATGVTFIGGATGPSVVMRGSIAALNQALATLTYTATPSANAGLTTITLVVDDMGNNGSTGHDPRLTATATTTVMRLPLPPVLLPQESNGPTDTGSTTTTVPTSTGGDTLVTVVHSDTTTTGSSRSQPTVTDLVNASTSGSTGGVAPVSAISAVQLAPLLSAPNEGGFRVAVVADTAATGLGNAVVVAKSIGLVDQSGQINFVIPTDAFAVTRPESSVTLSATLANGKALPPWLTFDAATGTFVGTAPPGSETVEIKVTASTAGGGSVGQTFRLHVSSQKTSFLPHDAKVVDLAGLRDVFGKHASAKLGLSHQIRMASRGHQLTRHAALLRAADQLIRRS